MANSLPVAIASDQSGVPVTGTFWQATQPVSGTVTANAGTGTFNIQSNASVNIAQVGGSSFALGQQLAAASLPIVLTAAQLTTLTPPSNTGYALDSSLTTIDTDLKSNITLHAGTNTIGKVDILGNAGGIMDAAGQNASSPANELLVAGQFNTTPTTITSGNVSPLQLDSAGNLLTNLKTALPAGTNVIGHVITDSGSVVNATLQAAASTIIGEVKVTDGTNVQTFMSTTTTSKFGADVNVLSILGTAPTTAGKIDVKAADGDVFVRSNAASTFPVTASIAASQTLATVTNVTQLNGVSPTFNSTTFTAKEGLDVNILGTLGTAFSTAGKIDITAIPAGTNLIGQIEVSDGTNVVNTTTHPAVVSEMPTASTGWSFNYQSALSSTKAQIKATAGIFGGYVMLYNPNTAVTFIQVFNKASANVTVGTTAPDFVIPLPGVATASATGSAANVEFSVGIVMSTGITVAATTTATGSTGPANAIMATFLYT